MDDAADEVSEVVVLAGHLIDNGTLSRVLDDIGEYGGDYIIEQFTVGKSSSDESTARVRVSAPHAAALARMLNRLQTHGVNLADVADATIRSVDVDGVLPEDFASTTNLPTDVRIAGVWVPVAQPEMDCGLLVTTDGPQPSPAVRTIPMSEVHVGDRIVCGATGIRVHPLRPDADAASFGFMASEVSSEKPQAVRVRRIAEQMRAVHGRGEKILWVLGPAVVHTGAVPALVSLVHAGYVDVVFGGNAVATHDIESVLFGTSLGVDLAHGRGVEHGHEHHIRAINRIRRCGSIAAAVEQGMVTDGLMASLVHSSTPFVLVGSVRDDGPLPDVITDVIAGQRAMRAQLPGVGFAIMVATMLHAVATGNILPATVPLVCVDINPATVTKLADRGSAQAQGIVSEVGLFLEQLASELVDGYRHP